MMKKNLSLLIAASILTATLAGCTNGQSQPVDNTPTVSAAFEDSHKIPYGADQTIEGAASVERLGDHTDSAYFVHPDFYNLKSTDTLTILSNFKTIQQATEWTCGLTSALMVTEYYNLRGDMTEEDLIPLRENDVPGATQLRQLVKTFENLGGWEVYSTYDMLKEQNLAPSDAGKLEMPYEFILDNLKAGKPIIVGWDEWGGHYQIIIGYDNMGTETTADDVLILADPYDTTDHCQDGYVVESFERFYWNWINTYDDEVSRYAFVIATPSAGGEADSKTTEAASGSEAVSEAAS